MKDQLIKEKNQPQSPKKELKDSKFPSETGINPYLNKLKEDAHNLVNMRLTQTIQAHSLPISS